VAEKIVVLDSHTYDDNRIAKQMAVAISRYPVFRLNFNFYPGRDAGRRENGISMNYCRFGDPMLNGFLFALGGVMGGHRKIEGLLRREFLREGDVPVFHVHDPYLLGLAGRLTLRFKGSRVVYDRHEYFETWKNRLGISVPGWFERRYGSRVSEVVFVSGRHEHFPRALRGKRVTVIPNYPWAGQFDRESVLRKIGSVDQGELLAVYFGVLNLEFDRDLALMFRLMRSLLRSCAHLRFEIAGRVFDERVREIVDDMIGEFGDRVTYLGEIPYSEVVERTTRAHLGFFLLRTDSPRWCEERPVSPNKVYEYLHAGTVPVIRANLDDGECIRKCSLTFGKETSEKEMEEGLMELLSDRALMRSMMMECLEVGTPFSWEEVSRGYVDCYERMFSSDFLK
jgi:hypothetical protein